MHFVYILGVKGGDVLKIFEINKTENYAHSLCMTLTEKFLKNS